MNARSLRCNGERSALRVGKMEQQVRVKRADTDELGKLGTI